MIAENVTDLNGHTLYPAQIKTLGDGTRIGLMGLVTHYINIWEQPAHLNGIKITAPLHQAQQTVAYLRAHADVVIGLYHGGYERDLATGQLLSDTTENIAWALTQALDLDILLTAHQHGDVQPQVINGVLTLQLPNQAKKFAVEQVKSIKTNGSLLLKRNQLVTSPAQTSLQRLRHYNNKLRRGWTNRLRH